MKYNDTIDIYLIIHRWVMVSETTSLLSQKDIESSVNENILDEWAVKAFCEISNTISKKDFPCLFGKHAWKLKSILFAFIPKDDSILSITRAITELTDRTKSLSQENRIYTPLLCVFENTNLGSVEEEHDFAWRILQEIHNNDKMSWPEHIPLDPENSEWSFCFNDVELFINISCPGHKKIRSRNLGNNIVFVINPRVHFDIVANSNDPKGVKIRKTIRGRSTLYNNGLEPAELGFYGEDTNKEWKQYALHELGTPVTNKCPLKLIG